MIVRRIVHRVLLGALAVAGCGQTATVEVRLADAPPDVDNMASLTVTFGVVEAHVLEAGASAKGFDPQDTTIDADKLWQRVTLSGGPQDVLKLQGDTTAELGRSEIAGVNVNQIRIKMDAAGKQEVVLKSGQICPIDVSKVDPGGVKMSETYQAIPIEGGRKTTIVVEMPVDASVGKDGDCAYSLKPVFKIKTFMLGAKATR